VQFKVLAGFMETPNVKNMKKGCDFQPWFQLAFFEMQSNTFTFD